MDKENAETRRCTEVFFAEEWRLRERKANLAIESRELSLNFEAVQARFNVNENEEPLNMLALAGELLEREEMAESKDSQLILGNRVKKSWKEAVNEKREKIRHALLHSKSCSMSKIAKETGCHSSTVKSVFNELKFRGQLRPFEYSHEHRREVIDVVDQALVDPSNQYFSTSDFKRLIDSFLQRLNVKVSKKFIRKRLHAKGRKYLKLKKSRRVEEFRTFNKDQLKSVIWTALQSMKEGGETILFLDEAEFPLYATSEHGWCLPDDRPTYNRRPSESSLYAICLCSQKGILAAQVYLENVNKEGVHYFLTEVLKRIPGSKRLVILLDNAGWHKANLVLKSSMARLLFFNVSRCWEANLIENCFAKLKDKWRRRPFTEDLQREVDWLVGILMEGSTKDDFGGYCRQYLRQLISLFKELG